MFASPGVHGRAFELTDPSDSAVSCSKWPYAMSRMRRVVLDASEFVVIQVPNMFAEVACVNSADHLAQDLCPASVEVDLGVKACGWG